MMNKGSKIYRNLAAALALLLLFAALLPGAIAQEVTAGLEGTVKDQTGANIAGASVTLTGANLIGAKTVQTDKSGYYRYTNLPPGVYTLVVVASGFTELKRDNLVLQTGRLPTVDVALSVGSEKTVVEVSTETPLIDVTQSRTQTNISRDEIDYDPRGRSFQ